MRLKYRVGTLPGPWPTGPGGVDQLWRLVDLCETSGIDSLWFSDRLSSPLHVLEPLTTMAAVAARTQRLKFGPSVIVTPFRSPVLLAREMAMIDYLSGGRMLPAVGIGVEQEGEFRAAGVPFKERGRRTDEAIAIMRRCWADDAVTFAGEAGREVPADHFGVLVYFCFAADRATGHATAAPFIPRGRVDDETLAQCTAFGPPEILIERLDEYVRGGGSKFIARPMCPPAMMEEQIARLAHEVVPLFHAR